MRTPFSFLYLFKHFLQRFLFLNCGCYLCHAGGISQEDCTELAGTPVELSFCTIEKYLNMTASGISADVVTCWYTDANFKRLETTGTTWALQDLLNKEIPGFPLAGQAALPAPGKPPNLGTI